MTSSYVTTRNRQLSRWQSVVRQVAAQAPGLSATVRANMCEAVDRHVTARAEGLPLPLPRPGQATAAVPTLDDHVLLSIAHFQQAEALRQSPASTTLESTYWAYSDYDLNWASCVVLYNQYYLAEGNTAVYYDWTVQGGNDINFGVLPFQLPNDATVLVIGDWGTGMNDAVTMLQAAISAHNPAAIIHLGDIYYSGTNAECQTNVVQVLNQTFDLLQMPRIPIFMIPGNHEYYSGGQGFYTTIQSLNPGLNECQQQASYFCLRTQDQAWQLLGMDTGVNDHDANMDALGTIGLNPLATGPGLNPTEATWHADKLQNFAGNTILMSHHQVFSANAAINGWATPYPAYLNAGLFETFLPFFDKVSAWFWGHEHNFAYYQNGLFGLNKARLLGNSAYEELTSDSPYAINYAAIPYAPEMVEVDLSPYSSGKGTYFNHAYAVLDFQRTNAADPITISYYQFPSWGTQTAPNPLPQPSFLFSETTGTPSFAPTPVWSGNTPIATPNGAPLTNYGPALAVFNDTLFMAYKGAHSNTLYLAWYSGTAWEGNVAISSMPGGISPESNMTPALATYNSQLYLVFKGAHSNTLYAAWYDGSAWAGNVTIASMPGSLSPESNLGPAAIAFNDQLVIVYKGANSTTLYSASFNSVSWSGNTPITTDNGGPESTATPSLAIFQPGGDAPPQLWIAYTGAYTANLYTAYFDGIAWHGNAQVTIAAGNPLSGNAPWLAQVGDGLVMLYTGQLASTIFQSQFDGTAWSGNQPLGSTTPISPETSTTGAIVPFGTGAYTAYIGAYTNTLYAAQLRIVGTAAPVQPTAAPVKARTLIPS